MRDEKLRQAQRAWLASGSPQEGAAYLRARVSAGELRAAEVECAAYLGYRPALVLLERPLPAPFLGSEVDARPQQDWLVGVPAHGHRALALVLIALTRALSAQRPPALEEFLAACCESLQGQHDAQRLEALRDRLRPLLAPPAPGSFNPTGTRDDEDVHFAMREWEARAGVSISQAEADKAEFERADLLVRALSDLEGSRQSLGLWRELFMRTWPEHDAVDLAQVQREVLAELGVAKDAPASDLCDPCDPALRPAAERAAEPQARSGGLLQGVRRWLGLS